MKLRVPMLLMLGLAACSGDDDDDTTSYAWETSFPAEDFGWLLSAWGPSADNVYAVGGAPDDGKIMRFDGSSWNAVDIGSTVPLVNWVYGFGPNDLYFVGNEGLVLHYDGSTFTQQTTPTDQNLWGVWGSGPNDVYAVGGNGREENQATILHYDGTAWTKTATPTHDRPAVYAYFKVWGTSADNVIVVGMQGSIASLTPNGFVEVESGTAEDLVSLWGTGPDNIVAVGGRNNGQTVVWDGTTWTHKSLAPLPGLNGVWMRDAKKAHIGGVDGTLATLDVDTLEYTVEDNDTALVIHALFGTDRLYAVGGSLLSNRPPYKGVALERNLRDGE